LEHLYEKLKTYAEGEDYPYHMPGHKRRLYGEMPPEVYRMDVTEIDGFDDLHCPEGILRDLQERVAKLYGAEESFCLVGGSTAGILSALSVALPEGGHLLMARNCHKSAYHAAYLRNLKVTYLMPPLLEEFGICDGIRPKQVQKALEADPRVQAVLIVSPTYEGRISPVREIAEIVHRYGKILIVDEAHGAHLGLVEENVAENSCQAGADLVIHSVHKTLPAMTQTALLHVSGERVDRERLRRFLRIYQSSSPSYVLMASIDNAVTLMGQEGEGLYEEFLRNFTWLTKELSACKHFRFLTTKESRTSGIRQDLGKLVIHAGSSGLTGQQIYDILREKYHLQLEMAAGEYCLAMFTVGDTQEGYQRMRDALLAMDEEAGSSNCDHGKLRAQSAEDERKRSNDHVIREAWDMPAIKKTLHETLEMPIIKKTLCEAWDAPWEEVALSECEGRIAAEFVNLYPPGTPIVVPGEAFTKEIRDALLRWRDQGLRLRGVAEDGECKVRCLLKA
jgi:arginine/lysine/ornithine decarboxylase